MNCPHTDPRDSNACQCGDRCCRDPFTSPFAPLPALARFANAALLVLVCGLVAFFVFGGKA